VGRYSWFIRVLTLCWGTDASLRAPYLHFAQHIKERVVSFVAIEILANLLLHMLPMVWPVSPRINFANEVAPICKSILNYISLLWK